jgi:ABC-type branched-subunit amino acid transport system substrate-binding protein
MRRRRARVGIAAAAACALIAAVLVADRGPLSPPPHHNLAFGERPAPQLRVQFGVDVARRTIALAVLSDLSGPGAATGRAVTEGERAYWHARNAAGGLRGWRVRLRVRDTGGSAGRARDLLEHDASHVAAVQQSFGYAPTRSVLAFAATRKLLVGITGTQAAPLFDRPEALMTVAPDSVDTANALRLLAERSPGARVAIVHDNGPSGEDALAGYADAVVASGLRDGGRRRLRGPEPASDVAAWLRRTHADAVVLAVGARRLAAIRAASRSLGFAPLWIVPGGWSLAGMRPGAHDRLWVSGQVMPRGRSIAYAIGRAQAAAMARVLQRAIALDDLTPRGILDAKLTLGRIELPRAAAVTFTPALGPPTRASAILAPARGGRWRVVAGPTAGAVAGTLRFAAARTLRPTHR